MTTVIYQVAASADDGDWAGTSFFSNNGFTIRAGKQSTLAGGIFARFTGIQISGTITSAYIRVRSAAGQTNTVPLRIFGEDAANPSAPTSVSDAQDRVRTTTYADWTPGSWSSGVYYDSPSLVGILQELVDSYTYDGSQAIIIFIQDNGAADNVNRQMRAYDHSATQSPPILHIEYTPANTPPTIAPNTADAAVLTPHAALEFTGTDLESNDLRYQIRISDRQDFAASGSSVADSYDATETGIIHPNPVGTLTWQGVNQVDDRPGQSFTAAGGILDKIRVKFGADVDTDGYALVRIYDIQGTHGTDAEPLNAADPTNTPTPGWLTTSDQFPLDSSAGFTVLWREFTFSGVNRIRLEPGKHYMLILDWIPANTLYDNTIRISMAALGHSGNAYLDGAAPANNGVWQTQDMPFEVYEVGVSLDKTSATDAGFVNTVNGGDTDPFTSGDQVRFTVQAGDALSESAIYHWQARAIDPAGSNLWSDWTAVRTFTVEEEENDDATPQRVPFLAGLF
jgi:hypothetical protein